MSTFMATCPNAAYAIARRHKCYSGVAIERRSLFAVTDDKIPSTIAQLAATCMSTKSPLTASEWKEETLIFVVAADSNWTTLRGRDFARNNTQCSGTFSMTPLYVNMASQKHAPYQVKGLGRGLPIRFLYFHVLLFPQRQHCFLGHLFWRSKLQRHRTDSSVRELGTHWLVP